MRSVVGSAEGMCPEVADEANLGLEPSPTGKANQYNPSPQTVEDCSLLNSIWYYT